MIKETNRLTVAALVNMKPGDGLLVRGMRIMEDRSTTRSMASQVSRSAKKSAGVARFSTSLCEDKETILVTAVPVDDTAETPAE